MLLMGLIASMQHPALASITTLESLSFPKCYHYFLKLSKEKGGTADQWRALVQSFKTIHATHKGAVGNRSLLLAGKSAIELYRRTGRAQDLDEAIAYLSAFNKANRSSPHLITGLQELKTAHLLKRKISRLPTVRPAPAPPPFHTPAGTGSMQRSPVCPQPRETAGPIPETRGPQVITREPAPNRSGRKIICNVTGNPFCPQWPVQSESVPSASPIASVPAVPAVPVSPVKPPVNTPSGTEKRASLPPTTVTDGAAVPAKESAKPSGFVVVIDPGHGGKDPGAVSRDGVLKEKDLTLKISKRIKRFLEKKLAGITVALTRTDDRFLSLTERTAFANALNADLFISVHCNSATDSTSKGIETFYLSKASSPRAMRVAARENGIPLTKMSDLDATLLDLTMISKKTESDTLASTVHKSLARALARELPRMRDRGVKRAPFYVLLGAKMPAILVECAFISNGRDRDRLTSPSHLDCIAGGIVQGAVEYLGGLGEKG
jgi:N-acetylmuramoyl-L-alanine amidase